MRFKKKNRFRRRRLSTGVYLVEVLVALGLGALLAFFLVDALANSMRLTTSTQNEIFANAILSELQEWTNAEGYESVSKFPSESHLLVNRTESNEAGSDTNVREGALLLDEFSKTWNEKAKANKFKGEVIYKVESYGSNSFLVTTTVNWTDSNWTRGRTVQSKNILKELGTGAYAL